MTSAFAVAAMMGVATAFAVNPFSDVSSDSWAYQAVDQLATAGIINGYPDGTFKGQNNITRYEMAQMIAKGMANQDRANAEQQAMLNRLADEFSNELNTLGVRVAKLEDRVGNVKVTGDARINVLDMTISEAVQFFEPIPKIYRKLKTIEEVGLGYITLGQQSTTLSGGEAQRVKLATELSKIDTGNTFYILDEPTTGLHFEDVKVLLEVLDRLVDKGNTVLVIEHNIDVIRKVDYIIDIGYDGGKAGGEVVAFGTPEEVAKNKKSFTAEYLK